MRASQKNCSNLCLPLSPGWHLAAPRAGLGLLATMLAISALAVEAPSQPGERLGTLFYSAAERSAMTRGRQGAMAIDANTVVNVNGIVKRERGNSTVWLNGQAVNEGQSLPPTTRTIISNTGVTLDGRPVRVGETLDIDTHERTDIVAPGAVTIKRKK